MLARFALVVTIAVALSGCAATVTRKDSPDTTPISGELRVKTIAGRVSEKAKEQLPDNIKFDLSVLNATIERALAASNLQNSASANSLEVVVTNVYIRGTFSAVMLGIFAGADNITGTVRVLDPSGKVLRSFDVEASYGLGGWAGGQDSMRINYLYEKFAELTRDQLRDQK